MNKKQIIIYLIFFLTRISHIISSEDERDGGPDSFPITREHCPIDKARVIGNEEGLTNRLDSPRECEKSWFTRISHIISSEDGRDVVTDSPRENEKSRLTQEHFSNLRLCENLSYARAGDYIVTARNKNYTLLYVREQMKHGIVIEEVSIPENRFSRNIYSWKTWFEGGAPNHTAWVSYLIELPSGKMQSYYSYTHQCWYQINGENNIFSQLVNLTFHEIPLQERKRRGSSRVWHPKMIVNGNVLPNISFIPYRAQWPKDGSELAGKTIEIYLPENHEIYPSYFPYWMQISGGVGKAYIRIVDSGIDLHSPRQAIMAHQRT